MSILFELFLKWAIPHQTQSNIWILTHEIVVDLNTVSFKILQFLSQFLHYLLRKNEMWGFTFLITPRAYMSSR
jgi:hypothetical protein